MKGSESIALHRCKVCGWSWYPRPVRGVLREPYKCPNPVCQSTYWRDGKPSVVEKPRRRSNKAPPSREG